MLEISLIRYSRNIDLFAQDQTIIGSYNIGARFHNILNYGSKTISARNSDDCFIGS